MVTRRKLRTFLSTLGLYVGCALVIGYFAVNAFTGNHGLRAQQHLDEQFTSLSEELGHLKQERAEWQRRVKLLQSSSIDPDTLDERARAALNYLDPRDLTLMLKRPGRAAPLAPEPAPNDLPTQMFVPCSPALCAGLSHAFTSLGCTL